MKKNIIIIVVSAILVLGIGGYLVFAKIMDNKKITTYDVIFETSGGTLIESQTVKEGEVVVKPNDPIKEGYVFVQWLYQGTTYDFSSPVNSNLLLTADWVEKKENIETFVVAFNSEGGTTIPNQILEKGNKVQKPQDPIKEGYKFKGWILNEIEYNFETIVENNIELKALWEKIEIKTDKPVNNNSTNKPNNGGTNNNDNTTTPTIPNVKKYTVTFNSNGGSTVSSQSVTEGNKVTKPSDPIKTNYLFNGWFVGDNKYDFNNLITKNLILTADWVLYGDVNQDGKINMADALEIDQYCKGKLELTEIQKKVADVNLDGVVNTIDVDIVTKYYVDKEGYGIPKLPYDSGKSYRINYELNGGTIKQQNIIIYAQISLPYSLKNPTKEEYVFAGWTGSNGNTPSVDVTIPENTTGILNYVANWVLYGDVNQDGKINMADALEIDQYCKGKLELTEIQKKVADVNLDGVVNTIDVDIVTKYYVDKEGYGIPKLPHIS